METSQLSMESLFGDELTSSPEVFHAKAIVSRERRKVAMIQETSGPILFELSEIVSPWRASLRTCLISQIQCLTKCSATWMGQATKQRCIVLRLKTSGPATSENGSGSWPTPQSDMQGDNPRNARIVNGRLVRASGQDYSLALGPSSVHWPTPTGQDAANLAARSQEERNSPPLNADVRMWPTPTSLTHADPNSRSRMSRDCVALPTTAEEFPTSHHAEPTTDLGLLLRVWTPPSCPVLNAKFVAWMMGYPQDWFDGVEVPETRRSKHSETP